MKRRKTRYLLMTFSLVIAVSLFGGVMIVSDSFQGMMLDTIDQQMGTADVLIRSSVTEDRWFNQSDIEDVFNDIENIEAISFRISGFHVSVSGTDQGNQIENSTSTSVYGIDINDTNEKELGSAPYILEAIDDVKDAKNIEEMLNYTDDDTDNRVVVITDTLMYELGINAGDKIRILPKEGVSLGYLAEDTGTWISYTVVAVIRDFGEARDFNSGETEISALSQGDPLIFTNLENSHELVDGLTSHDGEVNLGVIGVNDLYLTNQTVIEIEDVLENLGDNKEWEIYDMKSSSIEFVKVTMDTIRIFFLTFGLVALLLSIVLISNIFNIIREEQEYETGMYQAIGTSKSEIFKMFLIQGVIMGLIGATIGTVGSYYISELIFKVTINTVQNLATQATEMYVSSDFDIILLPSTLTATFILGFLSCLIASIFPSYKASKKQIIECLNPIEEKTEREKRKYKKPLLFTSIGLIFIIYGGLTIFYVLQDETSSAGIRNLIESLTTELIIAMTSPLLILFGIVILTALIIKPLSKVIVRLFSPYLKQTRMLTEKNILRHRKRTVLTFCMLTLTMSYLVGMSVMLDSLGSGVDTTVGDITGADVIIYSFGSPISIENELKDIEDVEGTMGVRFQNAMVQFEDDWIGHRYLDDNNYTESITINVVETDKMAEYMTSTTINSPEDMTLNEMLTLLNDDHIVITKGFADEYATEVGDLILVNFTMGVTFPNMQAMIDMNVSNAQEEIFSVEMEVIAIVEQIRGFTASIAGLTMGLGEIDALSYPMFISWDTYNKFSIENLPGGGTDMVLRQMPQTGNPLIDGTQSNWFNVSSVDTILNDTEGIEYYTTRMEYYSLTFDGIVMNSQSPVVGIHTSSDGNIASDSSFGTNFLIQQDESYSGSTLEQLLNSSEQVCVVDQKYVENQIAAGNPSFGIGSNISVFPQDTNPIPVLLQAGESNTSISVNKGLLLSGTPENLTKSDNSNMTFTSDQTGQLSVNINYSLIPFLTKNPRPISIMMESGINQTLDSVELQVLNLFTNQFDILGDINQTNEYNYTFGFNPMGSYINSTTGIMQLRIVGDNPGVNYSTTIDQLQMVIVQSNHDLTNPITWPQYKVIGILESPTLYNTERYDWYAGFEIAPQAGGNSVYINYEKARNEVFVDFKGSDINNDLVSSILVKCDNPENISSIRSDLTQNLTIQAGGYWSIVDLKSLSLETRKYVYSWYFWLSEGADQEEVLTNIQEYMQNEGYLVVFGFTEDFVRATFGTMIDLIRFITYGMLILAIVISMIGLGLHCLLTTMSRRREIGMLRSIGLDKRGVIRSISGETLVISFLGVSVGIIAGLLQGSLMVLSLPAGGFIAVTMAIPWTTIVTLVVITITAAIGSSIIPARWAANINIIDAVRTR